MVTILLLTLLIFFPTYEAMPITNEKFVTVELMCLSSKFVAFQQGARIDQDNDVNGEYGLFNEMAGSAVLRSSDKPVDLPPFIPKIFIVSNNSGYCTMHGYHVQVFLPHTGKPLTDTIAAQKASTDQTSIQAQEGTFIVYAWPEQAGIVGYRCFVLRDDGAVMVCANRKDNGFYYSGESSRPQYYAAMPADKAKMIDSVNWVKPENGKVGMDGQVWVELTIEEYRQANTKSEQSYFKKKNWDKMQ